MICSKYRKPLTYYKSWGVPPKYIFSRDIISITPPLLGTLLVTKDLLTRDYKYWHRLPGSVTFYLTTSKMTSMLILSFKVYYVCDVLYIGDEISNYYMYFYYMYFVQI